MDRPATAFFYLRNMYVEKREVEKVETPHRTSADADTGSPRVIEPPRKHFIRMCTENKKKKKREKRKRKKKIDLSLSRLVKFKKSRGGQVGRKQLTVRGGSKKSGSGGSPPVL